MAGKLIAHAGAQYIDREGLKVLETPQPTDSWTPIPHYDLVVALEGQLLARGITIVYDIFLQKIVPVRLFHPIISSYQAIMHQGQNLWTLHNAFTRHIQHLNPAPRFTATVKLGRFFERVG
jgi:hypothetical protein